MIEIVRYQDVKQEIRPPTQGREDWLTARVLRTRVNLIKLLHLNLKTIAALVNYSGAPSARVAPYLGKLVIRLSEKFGNRVTVRPYVRTDSEGKWRDSGVSPSGGGGGGVCYSGSTRAPCLCSYRVAAIFDFIITAFDSCRGNSTWLSSSRNIRVPEKNASNKD